MFPYFHKKPDCNHGEKDNAYTRIIYVGNDAVICWRTLSIDKQTFGPQNSKMINTNISLVWSTLCVSLQRLQRCRAAFYVKILSKTKNTKFISKSVSIFFLLVFVCDVRACMLCCCIPYKWCNNSVYTPLQRWAYTKVWECCIVNLIIILASQKHHFRHIKHTITTRTNFTHKLSLSFMRIYSPSD